VKIKVRRLKVSDIIPLLMLFTAGGVCAQEAAQVAAQNAAQKASPLWTAGFSLGTSFAAPLFIATLHGSYAPINNSFMEIGCDLGIVSDEPYTDYYSVYPFIHLAYTRPLGRLGHWYVGAGGGYMYAKYDFLDREVTFNILAMDLAAGFRLFNALNIAYTLRTNFDGINHKVSIGTIYTGARREQ